MKYRILVESAIGKMFQEDLEEVSGRGIKERVDEILTEGYKHEDITGKYEIAPHLIRVLKITKQS